VWPPVDNATRAPIALRFERVRFSLTTASDPLPGLCFHSDRRLVLVVGQDFERAVVVDIRDRETGAECRARIAGPACSRYVRALAGLR